MNEVRPTRHFGSSFMITFQFQWAVQTSSLLPTKKLSSSYHVSIHPPCNASFLLEKQHWPILDQMNAALRLQTLVFPRAVLQTCALFVWACLAYKSYFFNHRIIFFSHTKPVNSTFSHDLSTKQAQINRALHPPSAYGDLFIQICQATTDCTNPKQSKARMITPRKGRCHN